MKNLSIILDRFILKFIGISQMPYGRIAIRNNLFVLAIFIISPVILLVLSLIESDWEKADFRTYILMSMLAIPFLIIQRAIVLRTRRENKKSELLENFEITKAKIIHQRRGRPLFITYRYKLNGKKYVVSHLEKMPFSMQENYKGIVIDIKYSKTNPEISEPITEFWK